MGFFVANKTQSHLPQRLRNSAAPAAKVSKDVVAPSDTVEDSALKETGSKIGNFAKGFIVPSNFPNSVSKDYAVTRKWQLTRDLAGAVSWGYAAGMAISAATVPGIAAAGLTLFTYGLIKDRANQVAGFVTSTFTPAAARNPRAWLLGGDIMDSVGVGLMSAIALTPQYFVPLSIGVGLAQTFAGTMRGAAGADIGRRQAITDNLGELNAKNGNQGLIAGNLGLAIGGGLFAVLHTHLGAATLPAIGAATAAAGLYATGKMLRNLDMHPVNESAVRVLSDSLDKDGSVQAPDRENVWKGLTGLWKRDKIQLGEKVSLLKKDPARFEELKGLYADKNYILESVSGKPYIVLKQDCAPEDRFQAVLQAVNLEKLHKSDEFAAVLEKDGQDKADFWLVQKSLEKTPKDVHPLLGQMKEAGWSIDMLRFLDSGYRPSNEELAKTA